MKLLREGDFGVALAPGRGRVPIVYAYRTVRLESSRIDVPDVLVGVDPETDEILTIPAQSTPKLKEAREDVKDRSIDVRIPLLLDDVMVLLADHFDAAPKKFGPALVRHYISQAAGSTTLARRIARWAESAEAHSSPTKAFKIRIQRSVQGHIEHLLADSAQKVNRSDFVRGAILAAKEDVLDRKTAQVITRLSALAQAV